MGFAQGHAKVGGRKKGTPNKQELPLARALREAREKAEREVAADPNCDAHSLLRMVYLDTTLPIEVRIDAAKAAIGYELPKLNAIDARIDAVTHHEGAADLVIRERQLLRQTFRGLGLPSPKVIEADEVLVPAEPTSGDGALDES
jgi:hypothetical protein